MIGFALEGGGAKGAYQVGAYIALIKNGIKPAIIAGTSIGSVNAALMCQKDIKKLIDLWLNTTTDILGINSKLISNLKKKDFSKENLKLGYDNLKTIIKNKGIDTSELLKKLEENIDEKKLRKSKVKFGLVTVRLKRMEPLELTIDDIPIGKVPEYILASCYLPVFNFKPIIDNNYYLDGGFYSNIPINLLENYGCKTIYTIRTNGIGVKRKKINPETEIIEIRPKEKLGDILIFDKESNIRKMKLGYLDALKVLNKLDGEDYFFKKKGYYFYKKILKKIDPEVLLKLKIKFFENDPKELVIKIVEYILKDNKVDNIQTLNIKKTIKFIKKTANIKNKNVKEFINSCKFI